MGRVFVSDERVQRLRRRLRALVDSAGSVRALCRRLGEVGSVIHPNRIHAVMSDKPHRALNETSVEAIEAAVLGLGIVDGAALQPVSRRSPQYHVGDVVRLQTGGPRLTVTRSVTTPRDELGDEVEWVSFAWYTPEGALHHGELPAAVLRPDTARLTRRRVGERRR